MNNKTRFYAMVNLENPFQIIVEDPENKSTNFSIPGNKDVGISINASGILSIKPRDGSEVTKVMVRATDICGAYTDQEFVFDTQGWCNLNDILAGTQSCFNVHQRS